MLLCFLSVTFWQCQKEELYENLPTPQHKELKVQLLKGSDAQKIANRFKKEILAFKKNAFGHEAGIASREENEFTINYSEVLEVSDNLGNTNYTFRVSVNPEVGERTLFNFVINNRENQNKTFLLEYEMSEAFSLDYFNKRKTFDQFQGRLKIINIGSEGSNPCEDVIVEFNPPEPGGNQGVTYPTNPGENPSPTIPIAGTTGGHNIGVIVIGGGSGGGGGGGGGSNPSVSNGDNPSDGCDATLEEILACIADNCTWNQVECACSRSPRYFRFGNITVIDNMPNPCDGVIGAVGVLPEEIILDPTFSNDIRLKCIWDKINSGNNTINSYLNNFKPEFSVAHLRFKNDVNFASNYDEELWVAGAVTLPPNNYIIDIVMNSDPTLPSTTQNFPSIIIALEIIHETIHAEIFRKLMSVAGLPNVNFNNLTQAQWESYLINLMNSFPGLYDYYVRFEYQTSNPTDSHHELMAQHYIDVMVGALKDFDNNAHTDSFYESLAWIGLKGTVAWNNLPESQRNIIDQTIQNAIQNESHNCNN